MLNVLALNKANERHGEKSSLVLENQLKQLLSRLDVLNIVRSRESVVGFINVKHFCSH